MKCWDKSIKEGKRLSARPDLERTYIEKARVMFEEMELEWELEQLNKFRQVQGAN